MLSQWLQNALKSSGMTQAALARALAKKLGRSIDRAAVNKMASSDRKIAADEMIAISRILDVSVPDADEETNTVDVPVLAWVSADEDGRATYKRYRPSPKRFEPASTNPTNEPIFPERDPLIVGRVRLTFLRL